jgi:hypothetical protein
MSVNELQLKYSQMKKFPADTASVEEVWQGETYL